LLHGLARERLADHGKRLALSSPLSDRPQQIGCRR
jgi:hypothetical protein